MTVQHICVLGGLLDARLHEPFPALFNLSCSSRKLKEYTYFSLAVDLTGSKRAKPRRVNWVPSALTALD
jgi:hypothetical protein